MFVKGGREKIIVNIEDQQKIGILIWVNKLKSQYTKLTKILDESFKD